jgi:hypothetical protein
MVKVAPSSAISLFAFAWAMLTPRGIVALSKRIPELRSIGNETSAQYSNASAASVKGRDAMQGARGNASLEALLSDAMATRGESDNDSIGDVEGAFQRGIVLFNRGEYFACHEVWEEIWLRSAGDHKLFYQGLIQAAVAILHAERGNLRGAASTWRKACAKLDPMPPHHMGIALEEFRRALAEFIASANHSKELPPRPRIRPCK